MFTGIIQATGRMVSLTRDRGAARITIHGPADLLRGVREGDSVAVNGVCLTAMQPTASGFFADLAEETLRLTTLGQLEANSVVNLELPTPAGAPLGGHVVLGHVEGTGNLVSLEPVHPDTAASDWRLRVWVPRAIDGNLVHKGSIAVDGISLTIARLADAENEGLRSGTVVDIALIPHTYAATRVHTLTTGDAVNIETDAWMRRRRGAVEREFILTPEYLLTQGY